MLFTFSSRSLCFCHPQPLSAPPAEGLCLSLTGAAALALGSTPIQPAVAQEEGIAIKSLSLTGRAVAPQLEQRGLTASSKSFKSAC